MANTLVFCLIFAVVVPHGLQAARILSMRINTKGYTLGTLDKTDKMGLSFKINTYAKGNACIKVVNIEQLSPERNVDKIQVSCDPPNWSVTTGMVHYGDVIHMQTSRKKVVWAVYDLGDKCIQKIYKDKEVQQLGKLVMNLSREECDQVVATQKPKRKTKDTAASADSQPTETSVQPVTDTIDTIPSDVQDPVVSGTGTNPSAVQDVVDVGAGDALVTGPTTIDNFNNGETTTDNNNNNGVTSTVAGDDFMTSTTTDDDFNDGVTTTTNNNNNDGVTSTAAVISLDEVGTEMTGYYTNDPSITVNSGPLMLVIGTYYKGTECVKQIYMYFHGDMVEQLKVTCDLASGWGDNGYYQHGRAFFVLPEANNNFRALFRFKDNKCIKKTYIFSIHDPTELTKTTKHTAINQECVDLGNGKEFVSGQGSSGVEDTNLFTDEVPAPITPVVVSPSPVTKPPRKQPSKKPQATAATKPGTSAATPPMTKEYELLNIQKVVVLDSNVQGFQRQGAPNTVKGRGFDFTVERYVKPGTGECVKLVTITKGWKVMDKVKMSCEYVEPEKRRGFDLHISSIIFEDPPFDVRYVIEGGLCVEREYFGGDITQEKLSEEDCYELTKRTKAQRISGIIPGTEPITPEDLYAMDNEIVAVLDGSVKDFQPQGPRTTFSTRTGLYQVEVQHYVKGNQCVKLVSFKRNDHDQYFDQVKLSCKIKEPVVINDEDIELNYGNVIYIEDRFDAVFIRKGGECLKRAYFVFRDDVEKTDTKLTLVDCFVYTRWKLAQRKTAVRLNKPAPPKTMQAPGFGWLLVLNGDISGYKPGPMQNNNHGNGLGYTTQDFTKGDEECVRLVVIKIYDKVVDTFKVSCGPSKGLTISNSYIRYGKAFTFQSDKVNNKYKALFNHRDGSCTPRTYTVNVGSPAKMIEGAKVRNNECKDLREGKGNKGGITINGGTFNFGNNIINTGKQSGGIFGGLFGSWKK